VLSTFSTKMIVVSFTSPSTRTGPSNGQMIDIVRRKFSALRPLPRTFSLTMLRITDVLTHIFRKKAFSDYVKERKEIRDREAEAEVLQNEMPKHVKKRSRKLRVSRERFDSLFLKSI
jgi:hypothetical protein